MITPIDCKRLVAALIACLALTLLAAAPASAAGWLAPEDLSKDDQPKGSPQLAADPAGDVIVVWEGKEGETWGIQSAFRPVGGVWEAPRTVSAEGTDPQVAMDAAGNAVVVWRTSNGSDEVIQSASRPAGGEWGSGVTISGKGHDSSSPALAMNARGDAVAVWRVYEEGVSKSVEGAFRMADSAWQVGLAVADQPSGDPDVAIDGAGNALAVWRTCPPVEWEPCVIESVAEPDGGAWEEQTQTIANEFYPSDGPRVAMNPDGDAAVIWGTRHPLNGPEVPPKRPKEGKEEKEKEELPPIDPAPGKDGLVEGVKGSFKAAGGSWQGSGFLAREGGSPAIAIDGAGDALALWTSSHAIQSALRVPANGWQEAVLVSKEPERASYSQLAMSDSGSAFATWLASEGGSGSTARGATWSPTGGWGSPTPATAEGSSGNVAAAIDAGEHATAAWVHYGNSTETIIQAATYDASNPALEHPSISSLGASSVQSPTISKLKQSSPIWREPGSPLSASSSRFGSAPLGTTFTFVLDQDATVRLSFRRDGSGRAAALTLSAHSGMNRTGFRGKITAARRLKPGRYTLTATASNRNGSSAPRSLGFRIVKTS